MTANDPNQLSEAIRSRFLPVRFDYTNSNFVKQKMKDRLIHIASMEGFSNVDDESLEKTVNENFPDMRRMTKSLQFELNQ
jgi:DNA polymerase III delta prime subunit